MLAEIMADRKWTWTWHTHGMEMEPPDKQQRPSLQLCISWLRQKFDISWQRGSEHISPCSCGPRLPKSGSPPAADPDPHWISLGENAR